MFRLRFVTVIEYTNNPEKCQECSLAFFVPQYML